MIQICLFIIIKRSFLIYQIEYLLLANYAKKKPEIKFRAYHIYSDFNPAPNRCHLTHTRVVHEYSIPS